jgi:hypothetical protein
MPARRKPTLIWEEVDMAKPTGSATFAVRASDGERAAWRREAQRMGMTRNDWIRATLNAASGGVDQR